MGSEMCIRDRIKIVENRFPMLVENPPPVEKHWFYRKAKATGKCLVVVETPQHSLDDINDLGVDDIVLVISEIAKTMAEYMDRDWAEYFLWFRNKGGEIGVSLSHPHSLIYILPFTPVKIEREMLNAEKHYLEKKECLFCRILGVEEADRDRVVFRTGSWTAFIPFYAH